MSNEFMREERYIVFKVSDVEEHFTPGEKQQLARLVEVQRVGREEAGKPPLGCVVVESDWPEYEPTWKAIEARVTGAQPSSSIPEGWFRAIDEALVSAHFGVASADDTYEQAKAKLDSLLGFHVDVATDPAVNGGWQLVPVNPTETFYQCFSAYDGTSYSNPFDRDEFLKDWRAALAQATEAKDMRPPDQRWFYYYRVTGCKAISPYDKGCICWHAEGSGPFANSRHGDQNSFLEWYKPSKHRRPSHD